MNASIDIACPWFSKVGLVQRRLKFRRAGLSYASLLELWTTFKNRGGADPELRHCAGFMLYFRVLGSRARMLE